MRKTLSLLLLTFAAGSAAAAGRDAPGETYIPYVNRDGVSEWRVGGSDSVYVRAVTGGWYLVRTMGRCSRLKSALSLGFETSALGQLDRHGAILAGGFRCPVASITRSEEPPKRRRRPLK
jgi:hypothetical protein